jgi:hypothetical protein
MSLSKKKYLLLDLIMVIPLPFLMSYSLVEETAHEWLGIATILVFFLHGIFHFQWYKKIRIGIHSTLHTLFVVINSLLFLDIFLLLYTGFNLSANFFVPRFHNSFESIAPVLHLCCSHWGLVLMSIHLGLHGNLISSILKKKKSQKILFYIGSLISLFGIYAFLKNQFLTYLFPLSTSIFYTTNTSLLLSLGDYFSIIILFTEIGYLLFRFLNRIKRST